MLYQVAALCLLAVSVHSHAVAVSHASRVDSHGHHGWIGHGLGHGIGHGLGHGIGLGHHGLALGHAWAPAAVGWGHGAWGHGAWSGHGLADHGHGHYHIPNYKYSYSVSDPHTGDHKAASEVRHGGHVDGAYSLVEPDGNVRSVHYTADPHHGFNAVVHHKTAHHHIIPHHWHH